jgi:hypothetical protein
MYNESDVAVANIMEAYFIKMLNYPHISPNFKAQISGMIDTINTVKTEFKEIGGNNGNI